MHNIVQNRWAKFGAKIFRHFWDIAIFVLGHFILPHPVQSQLLDWASVQYVSLGRVSCGKAGAAQMPSWCITNSVKATRFMVLSPKASTRTISHFGFHMDPRKYCSSTGWLAGKPADNITGTSLRRWADRTVTSQDFTPDVVPDATLPINLSLGPAPTCTGYVPWWLG